MAGGTVAVNNKIYYPSGCASEGADGDRCSLELAVRYGRGITGGILKMTEDGAGVWCSGLSVAPVRGLRERERESALTYQSCEVAANFTQSLVHAA